MGDIYEEHAALAQAVDAGCWDRHGMGYLDAFKAGLVDENGDDVTETGFDVAGVDFQVTEPEAKPVKAEDPMRPEAKRGRYYLPHPDTGKRTGWRRMTNFCKPFEDTYHLELWKQRNVILGVMRLIEAERLSVGIVLKKDVKGDRNYLNNVAETALDVAEAYKNADEGTALHASSELANHAGGSLNPVPEHHRKKIRMYLDALAANGLKVVPGMIERVTVSDRYGAAGKFDLIVQLPDGSYAIADLKTGDDLERSLPGISTQLQGYEDGVNTHGIWDGMRYDRTIRVREDIGIVIHLPSTRDEVSVIEVDLNIGRKINETNVQIFAARKYRAEHVARPFDASRYGGKKDDTDAHWIERMNAALTYGQLVDVAAVAKSWNQWNDRLAGVARGIAREMAAADNVMGS